MRFKVHGCELHGTISHIGGAYSSLGFLQSSHKISSSPVGSEYFIDLQHVIISEEAASSKHKASHTIQKLSDNNCNCSPIMSVLIETSVGDITIDLYTEDSPKGVIHAATY